MFELLKGKPVLYLCGSIHAVGDGGSGWRRELTNKLAPYGFTTIDPCGLDSIETLGVDYVESQGGYDKVVLRDLYCVLKANAIVCYYTKESAGTCSELTLAALLGKPIYFITAPEVIYHRLNPWLQWILYDHKNLVFGSFEDFFNFKQELLSYTIVRGCGILKSLLTGVYNLVWKGLFQFRKAKKEGYHDN